MNKLKRNPHSPEVIKEVIEEIRRMTPDEALALLFYRDPNVEETDMLGVLAERQEEERSRRKKVMEELVIETERAGLSK